MEICLSESQRWVLEKFRGLVADSNKPSTEEIVCAINTLAEVVLETVDQRQR